jgi:membrane-associated protease RseP (regulator of RpoE activity)
MQEEYYYESPIRPKTRRLKFRLRALPADKPLVNLVLFLLTVLSTWISVGPWYSFGVIAILLAHEMGHYLMCRRYNIPATLPFFIPFPYINPFGTMGAMIQMRGFIPNRKALFDVGAAGPIAGLIVSIPAVYYGVILSDIIPTAHVNPELSIQLGEPLLFKFISYVAIGYTGDQVELQLHGLAYAGWVGLFVTSLNLMPIGQLDGGHIFYSLFGQRGFRFMPLFLAALGILTVIYYGWGLLFLLLLWLGRKHPPPLDDFTPLDKRRKIIAYFMFVIFILTFTPRPFIF